MAISTQLLAPKLGLLRGYSAAVSGSAGRLVFSLLYFIALANTLPIGDFGIFATASAAGVVISRLLAFGFVSPLYRIATIKPALIGVYMGGFLLFAVVSLPLVAVVTAAMHAVFFARDTAFAPFAVVIVCEVLLWRPTEVIIIINNGMERFGRGAVLVIFGTLFRAAMAVVFAFSGYAGLSAWVWFYMLANGLSLVLAVMVFYPGHRLRFKPSVYYRRMVDSFAVSGAEVMFYVQMELDKLLVLSVGGPLLAGIYAIVMRLVDLTAIPIRAFSMMLVQAIMRTPDLLRNVWVRMGIEAGIFALSTSALLVLAAVLHFYPTILGHNVAEAAPIVGFAVLVPAFRNLIEYQAELLYARGQTVLRAINMVLLAAAKAVLLLTLLSSITVAVPLLAWLNAAFAILYLISAALTYSAMRVPAKPL